MDRVALEAFVLRWTQEAIAEVRVDAFDELLAGRSTVTPLAEVVQAAKRGDDLVVRQWVADCQRERVDWSALKVPSDIVGDDLAVAAGLVEMMATVALQSPPAWTSRVGAASEDVYLVPSARGMRRTRELCRTQGPEPMRKRRSLAPPGYLTIA